MRKSEANTIWDWFFHPICVTLIQGGKMENTNKVTWYHKERKKQDLTIYDPDSKGPGDEYTQKPPLENEPYQYFDNEADEWVVDEKKNELAKKESDLEKLKVVIEDAERRQIRSLKAIVMNKANEEDIATFNHYEKIIQTSRPLITAAEAELNILKNSKKI
jgi:hypothetical protein